MTPDDSFDSMGRQYQEKVLAAILTDHSFADQMSDVLEPKYFTFVHLEAISTAFFKYREKHKEFPSISLIPTLLKHDAKWKADDVTQELSARYLSSVITEPLQGDRPWIEESSLEFCRRQAIIGAVEGILSDVDRQEYTQIRKKMQDALERGSKKDHGHEYCGDENIELRSKRAVREPISTGWIPLDRVLNGGWKRETLCTFIAATGAGKSMFLVNAACSLIKQGKNVLYVTLELPEVDIGLRCDSWFANVPIDAVPDNVDAVREAMSDVKGRLIIKGFPTKRATVDTIRAHVERLKVTKDFVPDAIIVDYADLLRSTGRHSENRHALTENYEELRALMQELHVIGITADQTNRDGLECDLVTIANIGECYAKAQICDLIMTITRNQEMKAEGRGKLYNAKSRLGKDGQVFDFMMDTDKSVKIEMLEFGSDPITVMMQAPGKAKERLREAVERMKHGGKADILKGMGSNVEAIQ